MNTRYTKEHIKQLNNQIAKEFKHLHQVTDEMNITYEGIARMVMLDRYANKDLKLITLAEGDLIVAKIKPDPKFPTLGTGFVKKVNKDNIVVEIEEEYRPQIDASFNHKNGVITISKKEISKPLEIFYEQIATRVGSHLAEDEKDSKKWSSSFIKELSEGNIIPAGRVLYGAGSNTNVTYFNCFVMPMPRDSREGLSKHRQQAMEIMSRGGGVGTNGSTLRPRDTVALTVGGKSSGAVSWLNDLAALTDLVQQGGSRRGAQMIMLQDWHPDILEFIISKMQNPRILKWISENFIDLEIRRLSREKLKFVPFNNFDRSILEEVVSSSKNAKIVQEAKEKLAEGGNYEVINPEFLSGANISVGITHEFMKAVNNDAEYELKFPDIANMTKEQKAFYDQKWHEMGDIREWEKLKYPVKTYHTMQAKELWDLINFCATYSAEPGVFFLDTANDMTNAKAYGQKVVCTNPCGEQPLSPYSVCNLAAINLANFINHETGEILWNKLENTVSTSVRLQDNIIDKTPYFLDENREQAIGERRIGMGVMGLHDFLIWSNKTYGSKEGLELIDKLFEKIATTAYITSAKLACEKGSFGFLTDKKALLDTGYIKKLPANVREEIAKCGLRNSHLLTIAPTGSTGTMVGVSTGLEPYFAFKYYRSGRLGKYMEVDQKIVAEWKEINKWGEKPLPEIFVSAMDITPEAHVDTQTVIQRWIDSSISKTVNAPKGYSVEQVEKIYARLYKNGAKGGTVYVDGSRDTQVLSITKDKQDDTGVVSLINENQIEEIRHSHADVPGMKQDKNFGTEVGDICPICKEGTVEDLGGCNTCTNCGAQLKCGI